MGQRSDVVICGAGVIGASIAYHLSRRGLRVTVVERKRVAYGASGTAAGLLSPIAPTEAKTPLGKMIALSMRMHRELAETLDGPSRYDYTPMTSAIVARTKTEAAALRKAWGKVDAFDGAAAPGQWIRRGAGVVALEGAAQLDPGKFTQVLLDEVCASGGEVLTADVQGVRAEDGRVTGVIASARTVPTDRIVVAMGPWSREADGWLHLPLPVRPLKGQILRYRIDGAPVGGFSTLDGNYAVLKPNGVVYAGTTEEEAGFDLQPTEAARKAVEKWGRSLSDVFNGADPFDQTACLRPLSADGLPIMGRVSGLEGAYVATGHGRKGIMLSTATGAAMAELIATGKTDVLDMRPFDPGRFRAAGGAAGR